MTGAYIRAFIGGFLAAAVAGFLLSMITPAGELGPTDFMICIFVGVFTTYIMANLAGNKSGKRADTAAKAAILRLEPADGKALLIVARKGFVAKAAGMNLTLDGRPIAQIKAPHSPRWRSIPACTGSAWNSPVSPASNRRVKSIRSVQPQATGSFW